MDLKEGMIKQNLTSGQLAVNSSLQGLREPDESRSTLGSHFLMWKNDHFHRPHCENSFVTSELPQVLERKMRPSIWNTEFSNSELVNQE